MTVFLVLFQFFNLCLIPIYYYLFVDVVPDAVMGRFMALFRVVATLSSYFFNTFLFGHALTHTREIYVGAALLYLVGFGIMVWRVREGEYPPPVHDKRLDFWKSVRLYTRECYSHPHYLIFNVRNAFYYLAGVTGIYTIFVVRDELGLSLDFVGKITGWTNLISMVLLFPLGALTDRFKPVPVNLAAAIPLILLPVLSFYFLHGQTSYVILTFLGLPIGTLMAAAELPLHVSILPRERYGQFGSANQIVCALTLILGSILAGQFIDWTTVEGTKVTGYRYLFLWQFTFQSFSLVAMALLYGAGGGTEARRTIYRPL